MTCDGNVGQLKEVMGKLVAEKQGRGLEVERGSQVINEF
jgi:transcriptional regulator with AAA-type ATPase domain